MATCRKCGYAVEGDFTPTPGRADDLTTKLACCPACGADLDPQDTTATAVPSGTPEWQPHPGRPPAQVDSFRVGRVIGRGGMGCVCEAEDLATGRRVAIKFVRPAFAAPPPPDPLYEARALAAAHHPHVVPVLHAGRYDGGAYLVMPLLRGESLADRVRRDGPLPAARCVQVGAQVARALAAAHHAGLTHGDVKPANIWLEAGGDGDGGERALVLDFGVARYAAGAAWPAGAVVGTPAFMAPEVWAGERPGPAADLFALGAVLYFCATGRRPFEADAAGGVREKVTAHAPAPPRDLNPAVPRAVSDVIMRLLDKDQRGRPGDAGQVATDLELAEHAHLLFGAALPRRAARWALVLVLGTAVGLFWGFRQVSERAADERARDDRQSLEHRAAAARADALREAQREHESRVSPQSGRALSLPMTPFEDITPAEARGLTGPAVVVFRGGGSAHTWRLFGARLTLYRASPRPGDGVVRTAVLRGDRRAVLAGEGPILAVGVVRLIRHEAAVVDGVPVPARDEVRFEER